MTSSNRNKWHSLGDFLKAKEERDKEDQESPNNALPDQPPDTGTLRKETTPVTPVTPVTVVREDVAPRRDFTRTANSIVRDVIPAGVFTGKGKQLYDFLYSQTRGAIVPARSARIPTDRVMRGAGMTRHTYRAHVHRLISFGLVEVEERPGEHGGNIYTVYLPEEVASNRGDTRHRGDRSNTGDRGDEVQGVQGSQVHPCDRSLSTSYTDTSGMSKTLIKTNTEKSIDDDDDDAALAGLAESFKQITKEITGKDLSSAERDRYKELADVLIAELRIAAARTTVSSVPSFLAEHLRRRLWKVDKRQARAEGRELPDETMKAAQTADYSSCPDCAGSGWHYPEGMEKGVKKCKHERLSRTDN